MGGMQLEKTVNNDYHVGQWWNWIIN